MGTRAQDIRAWKWPRSEPVVDPRASNALIRAEAQATAAIEAQIAQYEAERELAGSPGTKAALTKAINDLRERRERWE